MAAELSAEEQLALKEEIKVQGDEIRQLKAEKADPELIKAKVAAMQAKKKMLEEEGDAKGGKFVLKCPKGTRDYDPKDMAVRQKAQKIMEDAFKRHGAETIETPVFELREVLLGKYGEEGGKLVYDLQDQGGELLSLRYDLTVPFARYLAMNKVTNMKRYHIARVYRRDQPVMTRGRYREFYQCDFDIAGKYDSMLPEAECLKIIDEVLSALQLGEFVIKLNHRLILEGMFDAIGASEANQFKSVCASVDKLDKEPWEKVEEELIKERGLSADAAARLGAYVRFRELNPDLDNDGCLQRMLEVPELAKSDKFKQGVAELQLLLSYCKAFTCAANVKVEPSLARGLDYYTGTIFEAVIPKGLEGVKDEEGLPVGVGSVAGGGRYDKLVGMFSAKADVPCCGFSFGIERLFAILHAKMVSEEQKIRTTQTSVLVASAQKNLLEERMKLCSKLWDWGISAEFTYKANPKMLNQLQYAETSGIPLVLIVGEKELKEGTVKLRNTTSREETEVKVDDLRDALQHALKL